MNKKRKLRKPALGIILIILSLALLIPQLTNQTKQPQIERQKQIPRHDVKLYNHNTQKIETIPIEEYLIGVVAAEMPASFPSEALKAQAVAARTYIAQRLQAGGVENPVHQGADICNDPRHGQAWLDREQMKERWGAAHYYQYYLKIKWAVQSTKNQVLTYNNQLITAAYHACCGGGATENSGEVWQVSLPYLKSVSCTYCADADREKQVTYPLDKVAQRLNLDAVPTAANGSGIIKVIEKTSTGRAKTLLVGEKEMSATAFREALGLRSTKFSYDIEGDKITFTTSGYGHGVGMCQYGAKGMAENKKTYQEILQHYYPGTELTLLK